MHNTTIVWIPGKILGVQKRVTCTTRGCQISSLTGLVPCSTSPNKLEGEQPFLVPHYAKKLKMGEPQFFYQLN